MFPRDRRVRSEPGWGTGLDCGHDSTDEGMEGPVVLRKTISSLPNAWDSREEPFGSTFFLWGKRLLPGWFPSMGTVPRNLSDDKETGSTGRTCPAIGLCLGRVTKSQPRCVAGVNAFSSA